MIFHQFWTSFWPFWSDLLGPLGGLMLPTKLLFGRSKRGSKTIWKSSYVKKWTKPPWARFIPVLGPSRGHKSVVKQGNLKTFILAIEGVLKTTLERFWCHLASQERVKRGSFWRIRGKKTHPRGHEKRGSEKYRKTSIWGGSRTGSAGGDTVKVSLSGPN